jgi:ribose/xylose/arabinose/galactoside ABC-type transport system permease subunit
MTGDHQRDSKAFGLLQRREVGLALLIVLIAIVVSVVDPRFASISNWRDILVRAAPTVIVACGVMLVVVTAEIDISVGSLMALLAASMGLMLSSDHAGWPMGLAIPCVLLLGLAVGTITGLLVTVGRVPSIIVTLGMLTGLRGATTWIMGGENIDDLPRGLTRVAKDGFAGLPLGVWVAIVIVTATGVLIRFTPLGRRLFAVGSNTVAAETCGLSVSRIKLFAFAFTGLLTAIATLVDVPRLPKIESGIGNEFELLVVTCVVVGGVSVRGGRGTLIGVVLAAILMTMLRPVLTFLDVGESGEKWAKAIQGLFILMAVVTDSVARRRGGPAT